MQRWLRYFIFLWIFWVFSTGMAQLVPDLFEGSLPVKDRSQGELQKAVPLAIRQVLIKMTGNPDVARDPSLQSMMPIDVLQLVRTFSYTSDPLNTGSPLTVHVLFDQQAVRNLLRQAKLAMWRADRPLTLAWINYDQGNNDPTTIVSSDEQAPIVNTLKMTMDQLGLPFILPAMDLQDQDYINSDVNLPFDVQKLLAVGKRYEAQSIVAGNISSVVDGSWQGQWMYLWNGQPHQWTTVGSTPQEVTQEALHDLEGIMAGNLAVRDDPQLQTAVDMKVVGVNNLDEYALIMNNLKQLDVVAHIDLGELQGSTLVLRLKVVGGREALVDALHKDTEFSYRFNLTDGTSSS